jgi:hypothetical protein
MVLVLVTCSAGHMFGFGIELLVVLDMHMGFELSVL